MTPIEELYHEAIGMTWAGRSNMWIGEVDAASLVPELSSGLIFNVFKLISRFRTALSVSNSEH